MDVIVRAVDQVIDRGNAEVQTMFLDFSQAVGQAGQDWAQGIGLTADDLRDVQALFMSHAFTNNYDMIRQVITPIRRDIEQVFIDAMAQGQGPGYIQQRLNDIGLPWSPTFKYSPGKRAAMQAYTEYRRIAEGIQAGMAHMAGVEYCYNHLNRAKLNHADICIAATAAGLIKVSDMEKKYMNPPRHTNCACALYYSDPEFYSSNLTSIQLANIPPDEVTTALKNFKDKGSNEVRDRNKWRENLQWENNIINQLFAGANS